MLALDFYEGHACAVVGLPREMLALRNLLEPHVKVSSTPSPPSSLNSSRN